MPGPLRYTSSIRVDRVNVQVKILLIDYASFEEFCDPDEGASPLHAPIAPRVKVQRWSRAPTTPATPDLPDNLRPLRGLLGDAQLATPNGPCRADRLTVGAHLLGRDGTVAQVLAITSTHLSRFDLHDAPDLAPIRFDPATLPGQSTQDALLLAPDMPVFTTPDAGSAMAAAFPAKTFCNSGTIRPVIPEDGVHYIQLHLSASLELSVGGLRVLADRLPLHSGLGLLTPQGA